MNPKIPQLKKQVQAIMLFFMIALVISGATAMPVQTELEWYFRHFSAQTTLGQLLATVLTAVNEVQQRYPFLLYGNDWLAFAHFVIAVAFIGVLKNPVRNSWLIQFGLIACAMVIPFALVMGGIRGLPLWWRCIDCSFGIIGAIPLLLCYTRIKKMEALLQEDKLNLVF
ncbi:MAG: hypothetical protein U0V74_09940 [Chitinophagales bacterium]